MRRAVELGVDFIDTAGVYGPHVSEEIIREALHPCPEHLLITTKGGQTQSGPGSYATLGRCQRPLKCPGGWPLGVQAGGHQKPRRVASGVPGGGGQFKGTTLFPARASAVPLLDEHTGGESESALSCVLDRIQLAPGSQVAEHDAGT